MVQKESNSIYLQHGDALSVTDVQNDFLPGGALGVPEGDKIMPPLNRAISLFKKANLPIFFTRDWHPPDHCSFKDQGGPWPPHCVQNTSGAEFSTELEIPEGSIIVSKGTEKESEQYSTWEGHDAEGNTESVLMKKSGIRRIFIAGLATDYCVVNSVKDALGEGYKVYVLTDAIRAVNVNPGDGEKALNEMIVLGAKLITTEMLREKK